MKENKVSIRQGFWEEIQSSPKKYAHIIMIATKPDIIKQAPLYLELKKRQELVILVHTWQHYDFNLSKSVLLEFNMNVDINLNIYWKLYQKFSMIIDRLGDFLLELSNNYEKIAIPYVHWDTMTATTADKAAFLNKFAVVHVEAGIRTYTPSKHFFNSLFTQYQNWKFDWEKYYEELKDFSIYELWSIEPYPEQFDTRWVEASTGYFAVPVEIYKHTLISEWFLRQNIEVVWNTVTDAVKLSSKKQKDSKAFEIYPNMRWKDFVFITIHRRENCEVKERFLAIYNSIKKLIWDGKYICFLWLYASELAIDKYWLRDDIEKLKKKYKKNFAYGPALAHHHEVIDMISKAWCVMSDSGSMQEEANIVWVPCVTVRFWSDRIETILAGTNVIAPPVNSKLIAEIVSNSIWNKNMKWKNLYGENVSKKIVDWVLKKIKDNWKLFRFDHERLQIEEFFDSKI